MNKKIFLSGCMLALVPLVSIHAQGNGDAIVAGKNIAVVETDAGTVQGYIHNGIFTYKGIPYATAERFMAPSKPAPWKTVRTALTYGPVCPMDPTTSVNDVFEFAFNHDWGYTNERCQTLNVWTPGINDNQKRPVMVWLHGGGFTTGSAIELPSYDGENLSRKGNIVLVSVTHRLNVLGFLDLSAYVDKYKASPNVGLLDLVAALQWVKQNIAQFGGDPGNITIFGQSGGGGKVTCLMSAPSAKGLFQKAIVESGSYLTSFMDQSVSKRIAAAVLEELQFQPSQVDSLQTISYERLNAAAKKALVKVAAALKAEGKPVPGFGLGWGPILDGNFLPYEPNDKAAVENSSNVPLLVGTTKNEFAPFISTSRNISMDDAKKNLEKKFGDKTDAYIEAVKKAYPGTTKPSDYIDIDFIFRPGAIAQADVKAAGGSAPVYMYLFTWQSPVMDGMYMAMHCMELPFVFDNIARCQEMTGGSKNAYTLADKMSGSWISFAKTGNPGTRSLPNWPAYTTKNGTVMIFDNSCEARNNPDKELLSIGAGK